MMKPVSVDIPKLHPSILLALPRLPRKSRAQLVAETAQQLESDLEDIGDRNGVVYKCPAKGGLGVKSTRSLPQGAFFLEYQGDLITKQEAVKRDKLYGEQGKGCFLLYFKHRGEQLAVDATQSSRKARLVNHCKKGNLKLKVAIDKKNMPRVLLVAAREVGAGEVMEYDYGDWDVETVKELTWLK
jgi:histone-lysine N-methyltransferase SETD8